MKPLPMWLNKLFPRAQRSTTHSSIKRSATIFLGENRIVMHPNDRSESGLCVANPHVRCLSHKASVDEILQTLDETLVLCRDGVADPDVKHSKEIHPLVTAAGEKTWHAVFRSYAYVGVTDQGESLEFFSGFPEKGAFLFHEEAHWKCERSQPANVVAAFRAAATTAIEAQNLRNPPLLA